MQRLFPDSTPVGEDVYDDLGFAALAPEDRPYTVVNMVATVDGQARVGANTCALGNAIDLKLFAALRGQVDCVLAGTSTVAAEHYGALARTPERRQLRVERGLRPRPWFATVTRSGSLPLDQPLFQDPDSDVIVFSPVKPDIAGIPAHVVHETTVEAGEIGRILRQQYGVSTLLIEGGPSIDQLFFAAGVVDQLFLTVAPVLTGGSPPFPIVAGSLAQSCDLALVGALLDEDHLFLRYSVVTA